MCVTSTTQDKTQRVHHGQQGCRQHLTASPVVAPTLHSQKLLSWALAPAHWGDLAFTWVWGAHAVPQSCCPESSSFSGCDSRASAVLLWLRSSWALPKRRIAMKILSVVSHPFMCCTPWANFLWASLTSLHSPKATTGLALGLPQHPLLYLKYV